MVICMYEIFARVPAGGVRTTIELLCPVSGPGERSSLFSAAVDAAVGWQMENQMCEADGLCNYFIHNQIKTMSLLALNVHEHIALVQRGLLGLNARRSGRHY